MAEIQIKDLVKQFQGSVTAVDSLSLTIDDGEFVSFLGPSGCGKTTTLRMLAGLEEPTSGEISLDDRVFYSSSTGAYVPTEKRNMGLVFQSYALWPHMTVWDNIKFGLDQQKVPRKEQKERIETVLELLQIESLAERYSFQISGGQQQRVALARMLALRPNVLLLDEPLSNLDAQLRIEMRSELKRLHEKLGNTTIFVTHDQLEAMTLSTRIAVMRDGTLQQYGTPLEIYREPANLFVAQFVGSPPINTVSEKTSEKMYASVLSFLRGCGLEQVAENVVHIGMRPESIRINSAEDSSNSDCWKLEGTVAAMLPTGPEWILQVESDDQFFYCSLDSDPSFSSGDNCAITFHKEDFLFFDKEEKLIRF